MLSICLNILGELNIVHGKMYSTIYSTIQSVVQGTQGSTVLKGVYQRKSCVPINILVDFSFISTTSQSGEFEKYLTREGGVSNTQ